jgi:hypothetical protein
VEGTRQGGMSGSFPLHPKHFRRWWDNQIRASPLPPAHESGEGSFFSVRDLASRHQGQTLDGPTVGSIVGKRDGHIVGPVVGRVDGTSVGACGGGARVKEDLFCTLSQWKGSAWDGWGLQVSRPGEILVP